MYKFEVAVININSKSKINDKIVNYWYIDYLWKENATEAPP